MILTSVMNKLSLLWPVMNVQYQLVMHLTSTCHPIVFTSNKSLECWWYDGVFYGARYSSVYSSIFASMDSQWCSTTSLSNAPIHQYKDLYESKTKSTFTTTLVLDSWRASIIVVSKRQGSTPYKHYFFTFCNQVYFALRNKRLQISVVIPCSSLFLNFREFVFNNCVHCTHCQWEIDAFQASQITPDSISFLDARNRTSHWTFSTFLNSNDSRNSSAAFFFRFRAMYRTDSILWTGWLQRIISSWGIDLVEQYFKLVTLLNWPQHETVNVTR